ncbi:hypothetical protein EQJ74_04645 [Salmonella enterica]|nr:hypothetical protein [Salmonella enterica]EGV7632122.1 hypothetical protein [Salmonella enterica]
MLKRLTKRNPEKRRYYKKCRMATRSVLSGLRRVLFVGRISASAIRQSDERYQDTSNWFIRRINWFGSSSVPRSANSA